MSRRLIHRGGIAAALAFLLASCSQPAKQTATAPALVPPQAVSSPAPAPAAPEKEQIPDQKTVAAAQRALTLLGYPAGSADGVIGPATRRAILAFQKDRELVLDGRLTPALAALLNSLVAQLPKLSTAVVAGDVLLFGDGSKETVTAARVVPWEQDNKGGLVAIRPSTAGWPPAARAGLDWAISHALDASAGAPVACSSTGVEQHFEIHAASALSPRETALAGNAAQSCRHFELRDTERHYPGLACRDPHGEWYFFNSRIRLAHPARKLGPQTDSQARRP